MNRKKKEGLHGIGLKNVEHVITSYGGNYRRFLSFFIDTFLFILPRQFRVIRRHNFFDTLPDVFRFCHNVLF